MMPAHYMQKKRTSRMRADTSEEVRYGGECVTAMTNQINLLQPQAEPMHFLCGAPA